MTLAHVFVSLTELYLWFHSTIQYVIKHEKSYLFKHFRSEIRISLQTWSFSSVPCTTKLYITCKHSINKLIREKVGPLTFMVQPQPQTNLQCNSNRILNQNLNQNQNYNHHNLHHNLYQTRNRNHNHTHNRNVTLSLCHNQMYQIIVIKIWMI